VVGKEEDEADESEEDDDEELKIAIRLPRGP
jgi:hypothetical protein